MGFARRLAANGINLIITARSEQKLHRLADELRSQHQINVDILCLDLTQPDSAQFLFDYTQQHRRHVDILINNAGFGKWTHFLHTSRDSYQQMLALNIQSLTQLTHLFLPEMVAQKKGIVVNVASTGAFQPLPYIAVYGASKSFVLNFTEAIAGEYQHAGVQFLALCPGNTSTNFAHTANADTSGMSVSSVTDVIDAACHALDRKKICCVPGTSNYLTAQLSRIMPRAYMITIVANMLKKRVQKI